MIKVLTAALLGTIIGIIVMVVVIAISGTDTSGASSVGLGSLPVSTFSASTPTSSSGGSTTPPPTSGGGQSSGGVTGDAAAGVHQGIDHRSQQGDRVGLRRQHHAQQPRHHPVQHGHRQPGGADHVG